MTCSTVLMPAGLCLGNASLGATAIALLFEPGGLPIWFVGVFAVGVTTLASLCFPVAYAAANGELKAPIELQRAAPILAIVVVMTFPTSSLHSFYPFRLSLLDRVEGVPLGYLPPAPMLLFNYAFTAAMVVGSLLVAALYAAGRREFAVGALTFLALLMLVPNDNCGNAFNRLWIAAIGASPLMFAPASIGCLIAVAGLRGFRTQEAQTVLSVIAGITVAVGIGHITRLIW